MRDLEFAGMELFGSRPEAAKQVILDEVRKSDVYVGVFGSRYGSLDPETQLSMAELEYRQAQDCNVPCLIYIRNQNPAAESAGEIDKEAQAKLEALKSDLKAKHVITWFNSPDELAANVVLDLHNLMIRPAETAPPAQGIVTIEDLIDILSRRCSKQDIQMFALSLDLDFEDLAGEGKKVAGLIEAVRHREKVPDLLAVIRRRRPDIKI